MSEIISTPVIFPTNIQPSIVYGEGTDPRVTVDPELAAKTMRELDTSEHMIANTTIYIGGKNNITTRGFQIKKLHDRRIHGTLERNQGEGTVIRVNSILRGKQRSDEEMNQTLVHELEHNAQADRKDKKILLGNIAIFTLLGAGVLLGNRLSRKGNATTRAAATLIGAALGINAGYTIAPHEVQARKRANKVQIKAIKTK